MSRFTTYSSVLQFFSSKQHLLSWIDADYHKLEKGLALDKPRPGFGKGVAKRLIAEIEHHLNKYGDAPSIQNSLHVLTIYKEFNVEHNIHYPVLFNKIEHLNTTYQTQNGSGGFVNQNKDTWLANAEKDLLPFFKSRRSVRDFSDEKIEYTLIEQAVEMATYTPTVCNRQAVKVHAYLDKSERMKVISCQQGNAGFGDKVNAVLMVTVDRQCFFTAGERNQCWIDGGLFSMSLVYALHSLGLAACCLNWSATKQQDQKLRAVVNINESEAVIMMIGVGHLKDHFKVAKSTRKDMSHFLVHGIKQPNSE